MASSKAKKGKKQSYYSKGGLAKAGRLAKNVGLISLGPATALTGGQNIIREYKGKKPANSWGKTLLGLGGVNAALGGAGLGVALAKARKAGLPTYARGLPAIYRAGLKRLGAKSALAAGAGALMAHEGYKRYKNYKQTGKRVKGLS